jgi:hypothetical protein
MSTALTLPNHTPPKAVELISRQRSTIDHLRAAAEEAGTRTMRTLEITAAGAAVGLIEEKYQLQEYHGVPVAAAIGLAAHGLAFWQGGDMAEHLHNAGDGAFAVQGYKMGAEMGRQMRQNAQKGQQAPQIGGPQQPSAFPTR